MTTQDALSSFFGATSGGMSQQLSQQLSMFMQALQFQQQQAALAQAGNYGTQYGYAPGGNWMTWGAGGPTQPVAGTPTQQELQLQAALTAAGLQNALGMAGVTGQFAQPLPNQYAPGTVLTAPSQDGGGNAYGVVNADGSLQMVSSEALSQMAAARGTTAQAMMSAAAPVDWGTMQRLSMGPPTGPSQQTLAGAQQQFAQAATAAGLTGQFVDPTQQAAALLQQGRAMNGQSFYSLPQQDQQFWLQYNQNNPQLAAQAWAQGVNGALQQAGYQNPAAAPQQTLAGALQQAQLSGQYQGAPTEATREFNVQAGLAAQQAAQNWAQLYGYVPQLNSTYQPTSTGTAAGGQLMPQGGDLYGGNPTGAAAVTPNWGAAPDLSGFSGGGGAPTSAGTATGGQYMPQTAYGAYGGGPPQTLASQLQQAQLSGMYQGRPTEAASEYARTLALQQGQLGQQYLATAAQLQGPQNTFQLSNYLRGAQGNPNVPVYLQNLANNTGMASFQGTGNTTPQQNTMGALQAQMGGTAGQQGASGASPGWDYNQTLNTIQGIGQRGAQALGPGALERLSPDELSAFGSGLGAAGYTLPSFLQQYQQSRVGQQAPTYSMSLAG